jgi:YVTN family beta-propeller protein
MTLPASSASAGTTGSLPITSFHQIVADTAQGHLFFSEGNDLYGPGGTNAILVTDLGGNPVTTITGLSGVKGLALSPDGSMLYAALSGADEIAAISTSTLHVTATYSTTYTPYTLAFEDGVLWIGYENGTLGQSGVGYINPAAADPTFVPEALPGSWYYAPSISGDPENASLSSTTGTLVVSSPGTTPTPVDSFEISGTTVTSSDSADLDYSYSPEYGLDVLPGGSKFVMDGVLYDTTDIATGPESVYPTAESGNSSAAVAPNGTLAIAFGSGGSSQGPGIDVFPSGSMTADPAAGYYGLGGTYDVVSGLAWSADSSELFSVTAAEDSSGNVTGYTLHTFYPPRPTPSLAYSGTIRLTKMGLCLDDRNNNPRNGAIVQVWHCNGEANQKWQVFSDGTIRHNGLCLDAKNRGTANGTKVQLWACTGDANQKWDTRNWRIHYDNPAAVNKVLDDTGHGGNGTQQQIWTNTGGTNQIWATS